MVPGPGRVVAPSPVEVSVVVPVIVVEAIVVAVTVVAVMVVVMVLPRFRTICSDVVIVVVIKPARFEK